MKVMKFGGSSLGNVVGLSNVIDIIRKASVADGGGVVVVVSALAGITDLLVEGAGKASKGDMTYNDEIDEITRRHHSLINDWFGSRDQPETLKAGVDRLIEELRSIVYGVKLLRDLSTHSLDLICSYGELLSAFILTQLVEGSLEADARTFVITENRRGTDIVNPELSEQLIRETIPPLLATSSSNVVITPGFISSDKISGRTTTLGRGGSDYTAALIAGALNADVLEIWTHVNGFLTADPEVIPEAYTIPALTYAEATELCNFGSKVLFPPSIYPVCRGGIPIRIKNTYNPSEPGTVISGERDYNDRRQIKGVSSISDTALITVTGVAMLGVIGINRRIFSSLAEHGISVFMV
ncbi:MAG: aspartate kinase, partial [Duncaniella sp.]|nr:aspartate kinase [Duncaniella sp.]